MVRAMMRPLTGSHPEVGGSAAGGCGLYGADHDLGDEGGDYDGFGVESAFVAGGVADQPTTAPVVVALGKGYLLRH